MSESDCCSICGASLHHPLAHYCRRCKKLIDRVNIRKKPSRPARARALHEAWDSDSERFRCHYTKVLLVEDNKEDPRYLTFDHLTPGEEQNIVVVAWVINDMKSDMADGEFRAMVLQLASKLNGGQFDESVFALKHWKR